MTWGVFRFKAGLSGLCVASAVATILSGPASHADFFTHRWQDQHETEGRFRLAADLSLYRTGTNFRADGTSVIPGNLDQYTRIQTDFTGAYGALGRLTLFGRLTWAQISLSDTSGSQIPSTSGMVDQTVGFNYRFVELSPGGKRGFSAGLQLQFDIPAYDNTAATEAGVTLLGDQTTDISIGPVAEFPLGEDSHGFWAARAGAAWTIRSRGSPSGLPWSVEAVREAVGTGLSASLGFSGYHSAQTAASTGLRLPAGSAGAGGSYVVNSPGPRFGSVRASAGYEFSPKIGFSLSVSKTLFGRSAPDSLMATLGATFHLGTAAARAGQAPSEGEYPHGNKGFVSYGTSGKVLKTNDRMNLVKIDKGSDDGLVPGQVFDFFEAREGAAEENRPVARGRVTSVKPSEAILQISEYFREVWIDEGFVARRVL